ncbi:hypothetical protein N7456_010722 [Penicillium angulare]|uniref:Carboxylic ester hydrolase n=1 Tax=Penicillium angulare TaxID=116970 RepID=A0A9W9K702_9EURO|nr:hypothetical protein N7456_010722 [Penicillium angulare]
MKLSFLPLVFLGSMGTVSIANSISCTREAVSNILPKGVSLSFVQHIPKNGTFTVPEGDTGWPIDPINLPELCAIGAMVAGTSTNATFGFGVFLPVEWNGRTLTVGNGGLAGGVNWVDMGTGVKYGHAVFSTDTGHNSSTTDATWAYQNLLSQTNWGWKALHETVTHGKFITEAFYETKPSYHYYQGCSTGGRQGFKEAEMFPDDFDGVISGAPAWWTSHQQIWQFWTGYVNYISNASSIPTSMFDTIGREVLRQCDGQDGLVDTIISDPYGCNFNPETLLCIGATTTDCLTPDQLNTFDALTRDYMGVNSTLIFPSWLLGSEHFWDLNIAGGAPNIIGLGYIQYMMGLGSDWNWRDFDESIVDLSEQLNPGQADASNYDLAPFFRGGKKLIHYHGLSDGGIATGASFYLHDQIERAVSTQNLSISDSYRFFPIPGMGHCTDTADYVNAPYFIAGITMTNNGENSVPGYEDARHDVMYALMDWVENGKAPDYIIGTAWDNFTTQNQVTRPNERRTINREALGFYNALAIAAVYEIDNENIDLKSPLSFASPLQQCVQKYPFLRVIVKDTETEKPSYHGRSEINLQDHISIIHSDDVGGGKEMGIFEKVLPPILDRPWPANIPAWRIIVLPLDPAHNSKVKRCLIAFSFSHTLGDGMVGVTFHETFLQAWRETPTADSERAFVVNLPIQDLPLPFDTPERLPISWGFLLGPVVAAWLPKFLANMLGLRASASTIDAGTWTGSRIFFDQSSGTNTQLKLLEIEAPLLQKVLQLSRQHDAKFTATLHQMILRALSKGIRDPKVTNFVSATAVDMRGSIGTPGSTWGLFVSGHYEVHFRPINANLPALPSDMWSAASVMTKALAGCGSRLQDQAIGLLRYAPSIMSWTKGKIGQLRDCSYELSNLLSFRDVDAGTSEDINISKMIFSQPGNTTSGPLVFNIISVQGGHLVCAVSWQHGALGLPIEEEVPLVNAICASIRSDFESLGVE